MSDEAAGTSQEQSCQDVVGVMQLEGGRLEPADCLLLGAWVALPGPQGAVERLALSYNAGLHGHVLGLQGGGDEVELHGFERLIQAVQVSSVCMLELQGCALGPAALALLAPALPGSLTELRLGSNPQLKREGLQSLGTALSGGTLDLSLLVVELGGQRRQLRADSEALALARCKLHPNELLLLGGWLQMPAVRGGLRTLDL
eukprot:COSAG01_NODE_1965_length_8779_cov_5.132604_10_plen_202_part_00